uniref:Uncharacterized protein n=1 Tax=Moniliophthora roreri TaxID=221103 RepID=A0A0W0FH82_MONRR
MSDDRVYDLDTYVVAQAVGDVVVNHNQAFKLQGQDISKGGKGMSVIGLTYISQQTPYQCLRELIVDRLQSEHSSSKNEVESWPDALLRYETNWNESVFSRPCPQVVLTQTAFGSAKDKIPPP